MNSKLIVAAMTALMVLAPAAAFADGHESIVRVVHAVDGVDVDVWINGDPALENFSPRDVAGPLTLAPGDYDIEVYPTGSDPDETDPAITLAAALEGGENLTLVAHRTAGGDIASQLAAFPTDVSGIDCDTARIEVRHTAAAGAVTLSTGDAELGEIALGEVFAADVDSGELPVTVTLGDGTELLDTTLDLADGSYTILHAYLDGGGFDVIPVAIDGLSVCDEDGEQVHTVPAGDAGLAAPGMPEWVLGLMALGAAGVVVPALAAARRRS